ncbi:MAG: hypothetical protein ABIM64_04120 [candidate division WOR-3 bacterium]
MNQEYIKKNNDDINRITIKSDEIVYICGKRKTGKSYLMEKIGIGYERYIVYDGATHQHSNMGQIVRTPEQLKKAIETGTNKIVCQPWIDNDKIFDSFCKIIWEKGNFLLMIEEIGNYCTSYSAGTYFDMIVRVGRNRGIGIWGINQRPGRIWLNFIGVIDHWFIFSQDLPSSIEFLEEYIGYDKANSLKTLPKRYFYYKNTDTGEVIKCNPIK